MRCVTCGKRIGPQLKECPNCGAMVTVPEGLPRTEAQPGAAGLPGRAAADWKTVLKPPGAPPPLGDDSARRPSAPASHPAAEADESGAEAAEQEQPVAPPAWTRFLVPGIFILWMAFRSFGPELRRIVTGEEQPERGVPAAAALELRKLVLSDRLEGGNPVSVRDRFSRSTDRSIIALTAWTGTPGASEFEFHWRPPTGKVFAAPVKVLPAVSPGGPFAVLGELTLGEFIETGRWQVEVRLDGNPVAHAEFTIEP